jgi:hypothetical protein
LYKTHIFINALGPKKNQKAACDENLQCKFFFI